MTNGPKRTRNVLAALALAAGVVLGGSLTPVPASAAPAPPQLSIAVDNQKETTTAGDALDYTVTVTNLGTRSVKGLVITQTVPAGTALGKADRDGEVEGGEVRWEIDLPASDEATFRTTLTVDEATPDELLRLATVACAKTSPKAAALVCASDSDQLPAGAAAEEEQAALASPPVRPLWWYVGGAAALMAAGTAVVALTRRAHRPGRARRGAAPQA